MAKESAVFSEIPRFIPAELHVVAIHVEACRCYRLFDSDVRRRINGRTCVLVLLLVDAVEEWLPLLPGPGVGITSAVQQLLG
jgi:hypothetical protein